MAVASLDFILKTLELNNRSSADELLNIIMKNNQQHSCVIKRGNRGETCGGEVRASGLRDAPHWGRARVTICHVSTLLPRRTMLEESVILKKGGEKNNLHRGPRLGSKVPRTVRGPSARRIYRELRGSCGASAVCRLQPAAL